MSSICVKSKKVPVYPDDFYSFAESVPISDKVINHWINEALTELSWNDKKEDYYIVASGDTHVCVTKDSEGYHITVSKRHADADIFIED